MDTAAIQTAVSGAVTDASGVGQMVVIAIAALAVIGLGIRLLRKLG